MTNVNNEDIINKNVENKIVDLNTTKLLSRINEIRIQGVLLKKTCQRLGRHPKIRRWKPYYCVVSIWTFRRFLNSNIWRIIL